ncbi:MAG: hypothetical protein ACI9Y7_001993 [Dokdonia sp.]|jgi:hypothetical protein
MPFSHSPIQKRHPSNILQKGGSSQVLLTKKSKQTHNENWNYNPLLQRI